MMPIQDPLPKKLKRAGFRNWAHQMMLKVAWDEKNFGEDLTTMFELFVRKTNPPQTLTFKNKEPVRHQTYTYLYNSIGDRILFDKTDLIIRRDARRAHGKTTAIEDKMIGLLSICNPYDLE